MEETIEEQEKFERKKDVKQELEDLKDEGMVDGVFFFFFLAHLSTRCSR